MAPLFWGITRKDKRFVVTVRPGAHPKGASIPTAVFLRDTLGLVKTMREAKASIYAGHVAVDGVKRRSLHHGVGLMDVVELEGLDAVYRMLPSGGTILKPVGIGDGKKDRKICKVTGKTTIKGGKTQLGFHDGRSAITDADARVGDSCLIRVPGQEILEVIKLEAGAQALVTGGTNAGQSGTVAEIKKGTFVLDKMATIRLAEGDREIEIPGSIVMAVGRADGPVIQIK